MKLLRAFPLFLLCASCACAEPLADTLRRNGTTDAQLRVMFMDRAFHDNTGNIQQSFAIGGRVVYETPAWSGVSIGAAGYTSQRLPFSPEDWEGTRMLAPGQKSFSVLGQSYLKYHSSAVDLTVYRQILDTPFLNPFDFRMVPVTYEAYTARLKPAENVQVLVSQVAAIKKWNDTQFHSLSDAAGYGGNNQLTMAGVVYAPPQGVNLQLWNYQAYNLMNTSYFQADLDWRRGDWRLTAGAQAFAQADTGKALAGKLHAAQAGVRFGMGRGPWNAGVALTRAAVGDDVLNPWGGYPGYTSIMEEDCDFSGETAWLLKFDYEFSAIGAPGLKTMLYYTQSYVTDSSWLSPPQRESNINLRYEVPGKFKGLSLLVRQAFVTHSHSTNDLKYGDTRFILNYNF